MVTAEIFQNYYDQVARKCDEIYTLLSKKRRPTRYAVCFDIDDTLVYSTQTIEFVYPNFFKKLNIPIAIPPVLNLFNKLEKLGFKIFLITARNSEEAWLTEINLERAGYENFERIYYYYNTLPSQRTITATPYDIGRWKQQCLRNISSSDVEVCAFIDDSTYNIDPNNPTNFKLPIIEEVEQEYLRVIQRQLQTSSAS